MKLQETIDLQVLKRRATLPLTHGHIEAYEAAGGKLIQLSAKVSPELVVALDEVCKTLDIVKREFIEGAVADAVAYAEAQIAALESERGV
jgi:hypothetical protein